VVLAFSAYIVPQFKGGSLAAEYVLGIPSRWATLLVGGVFVSYVLLGGMISVTWTDFMQGILMFALMVGLAVTAVVHFGGLAGLVAGAEAAKPRFLDLDPGLSVWTCVGFPLSITIFVLSAPHTVMRLFTARNVRQGRAALALTAALCLAFHLVGYLGVGAAALIIDPALRNTDQAYVVAMGKLFPVWARGLGIAAILAAIMSTTAGLLLTAGAELSANLYRRFLRPAAGEGETLLAARIGMLAIGAVTTVLALFDPRTIGVIVGQLVAALGSAFAAPLVAGVWWRRANAWGGALGIAGGFGSYVAAHYALELPPFAEVLVSFPASIAGVVLGSLLSAPPSDEAVRLVETLHRGGAAGAP
jgi:sodium/pantothenate symporter